MISESYWSSYSHALGQRLRILREMRGLTQRKLAQLVQISRTTIANIERNESNTGKATIPGLHIIYSIADVLQVPPAVLLPGVDKKISGALKETEQDFIPAIQWPTKPEDIANYSEVFQISGIFGQSPDFNKHDLSELPKDQESLKEILLEQVRQSHERYKDSNRKR